MTKSIEEKIQEIKRMAVSPLSIRSTTSDIHKNDSLAKAMRTQADADRFTIELEIATQMAKIAADRDTKDEH